MTNTILFTIQPMYRLSAAAALYVARRLLFKLPLPLLLYKLALKIGVAVQIKNQNAIQNSLLTKH